MTLRYNLQFFASDGPGGEKTEPATQKKLDDARKEGQVAKSKEVANAAGLITLFLVLKFWVGHMGTSLMEIFGIYNKIPEYTTLYGGQMNTMDITIMIRDALLDIVLIILPLLLIGFAVAFVSDLAQVKWKPTAKTMKPKFSKLDPIKGFKKIFSAQSLMELVKSLLKIGLVFYVVYTTLKDQWGILFMLYDMPLVQAIVFAGDLTINLGLKISFIYIIIAAADFIYQKQKFNKDMKMTKQEIKDEYKNSEGNPEIKGKIRQKMMQVSRQRMMQSLPEADVVITNPTHFAVAIKYDAEVSAAPIVLAKGEDYLAQRIKEVAKENKIEIVENKPLARMLYHNVEVGEQVPPELYQTVAEVLAFVYQLKGKA